MCENNTDFLQTYSIRSLLDFKLIFSADQPTIRVPDWQYNSGQVQTRAMPQHQNKPPALFFSGEYSTQGCNPSNSPLPACLSVCQQQAPSFQTLPASACLSINGTCTSPHAHILARPQCCPPLMCRATARMRTRRAPARVRARTTCRPAGPFNGELTIYYFLSRSNQITL